MRRIENAFRQIKPRDVLAPLIFMLMLVPAGIFRLANKIRRQKLWLVAESGDARDNGYHFYKYVREKHPDDMCYYAVRQDGAGYEKVAPLGNIIRFGSLRHWLYYMAANLNISSQKSGNPCPIFWYLIHVKLGWFKNRVFLQHGITHNAAEWIKYDKTKFKYFICGAKKEHEFVKKTFGYPEGNVILTGFARWDALKDSSSWGAQKSILIMPTWRNWLGGDTNSFSEVRNFKETEFFKCWNELLNDDGFISYLEGNDIVAYFYPHINMQKFLDNFETKSRNVRFVSTEEDIQEYLMKCDLMVTDYSSVAFDFAYLEKPVIYYQFDQKEFRSRQYKEGYFSYEKDGFGPVVDKLSKLVDEVEKHFGGTMDKKYLVRAKEFFERRDNKNSERIYKEICGAQNNDVSDKKRIKVMHVVNSMNMGGIETFIMNLYRNISREKYEFVFLANAPGKYYYQDEIEALGGRFIKIDPVGAGKRLKHLAQLRTVIRKENPDVIHCHTYFDAASVMMMARLCRVPVRITHSHTTEAKNLHRKFLHWMLTKIIVVESTNLLACGEEAGKALYGNASFQVINNGIDLDKFIFSETSRRKIRKEIDVNENDIIIGHVGRFEKVKNHEYMIEILKKIISRDAHYKLVLVGDGTLRKEIEALVKKNHLDNQVIFAGNAKNANEYYSAFDIMVFPSIFEGLPLALVEAQANGLPVVASSGVTEEAKINDNFRRLSLDEGAEKWAQAVCEMVGKRVKPNEKINDYSIEKMVEEVRGIYEK